MTDYDELQRLALLKGLDACRPKPYLERELAALEEAED